MKWGYNTSGLADHSLAASIKLIHELGYLCVAITLDHHRLNPYGPRLDAELEEVKRTLEDYPLAVVIETGARYLLDPRLKHQPTLISPRQEERDHRIDFLRRSIDIAADLNAECVSFWSGVALEDEPRQMLMEQLCESLRPVIDHAGEREVTLAFEPEPGHLIDTMLRYDQLLDLLSTSDAERLKLTIDIGHLHCLGEVPIAQQLRRWQDRLVNIHIEDMHQGVHEHLMFGEGEIEFGPVVDTLVEMGYKGPVTVELPRHSHRGPEVAAESLRFLRSCVRSSR
jgi:L-ribulose-5-phosphate 3-epimerase